MREHIANRMPVIRVASKRAWLKAVRGDDLPMVGRLVRESKKRKHRYVLTLKFKHSKRHYVDEVIYAVTKKEALKAAKRMFPSAKIS